MQCKSTGINKTFKSVFVADNGKEGDAKLVLWRDIETGMEAVETNGDPCWEDDEGFEALKKEILVRWTCNGSVRGCCGITHRTLEAAMACCAKDQQGCARQGGYSDRKPMVAE